MTTSARDYLKNGLQDLLARRGLRIVRWPPPPSLAATDGQGAVPPHFPIGTVKPWTIPDDLRVRTEPWARVLVSVYDDPASWPSSIAPEAGMLLHTLVRNIQPRLIIETGTCLGVSTIWMASALSLGGGGRIMTFDDYRPPPDARLASSALFQNRLAGVRDRLNASGLSHLIDIRTGDSAPTLAAAAQEIRQSGGAQLVFIDADHTPRGTAADFAAAEPILAVGGYVIVHDVFPEVANHLGPRVVLDNLTKLARGRYESCDIYTAQTNYGLGVMRRLA